MEDSTGSADLSISSAELVERCPLTTRHLVKRMQRRLQEAGVRSRRRATRNSGERIGLISQVASTAEQGPRCTIGMTTCETSAWKPLETRQNVGGARPQGGGANASHRAVQAWTPKNSVSSTRTKWREEKL